VIYTDHLLLLGETYMIWVFLARVGGYKECINNSGAEAPWKTSTCKSGRKREYLDLEDERLRDLCRIVNSNCMR
jgi:hypothetical protein